MSVCAVGGFAVFVYPIQSQEQPEVSSKILEVVFMNRAIKEDLYRYIGKDCEHLLWQLRYFLFTPGFRYIYFFRRASQASFFLTRLFWHFCMRMCMYRTGIQIPVGTRIGRGFRIVHFGPIVINPFCRIGTNFNISQGCLIGNSLGEKEGVPTIGDRVCMNAMQSL